MITKTSLISSLFKSTIKKYLNTRQIFYSNNLKYVFRETGSIKRKNIVSITRTFSISRSFSNNSQIRSSQNSSGDEGHKNAIWYILSALVIMIGASYAAVPLFKIFCESQGIDVSTDFKDMDLENLKKKLKGMRRVEDRMIRVKFVASTSGDLLWKFEPCQDEIIVVPGETALAFFRAKNLTNRSIVGIG